MQLDLFEQHVAPPAPLPPAPEPVREPLLNRDQVKAEPLIPPATLEEACALYEDAASQHRYRTQIRSSFRTVGRVLGRPLDQIPADPERLRPLLAKAQPGMAGLKPRTWVQAKSHALRGLRDLGVDVVSDRDTTPLLPEWERLSERLPDRRLRIGLSRLLKFFSRENVAPSEVTPEVFERFKHDRTTRAVRDGGDTAYRQVLRHWNKAVSSTESWPQVKVSVPSDPRRYSLDWEEFPLSFVDEVERFLAAKHKTDPFADDYTLPIRAKTLVARRKMLRQMASALVLSKGVPVASVTCLAVLTDIENVKGALKYLCTRQVDGEVTEGLLKYVWLLRTVARHWLKDEAAARKIADLSEGLSKNQEPWRTRGITAKNRARLRQFDDPRSVEALVGLPSRTLKAVSRKPEPSNTDSTRVMYALMIGILTFVPIRSKNLTELELGSNIIDRGKGARRRVRLHLPGRITKTYRDYEAPIPEHLYPLLDEWVNVHRPRKSTRRNPLLFPNPSGELRSRDALATKLTGFIERETGLKMNLHLFRHLAAKLYLDHDPNGIEVVQQLLGHTSIQTTLGVYAELQRDPAFRNFEDAVLRHGSKLPPVRKSNTASRRP